MREGQNFIMTEFHAWFSSAGMPECHNDKINLSPVFHCRNAGMPECHYNNDYDRISCLVFLCRNAGMLECPNVKINLSPVFHWGNAGMPEGWIVIIIMIMTEFRAWFFPAGMPECRNAIMTKSI